jgi:hypothetical protein
VILSRSFTFRPCTTAGIIETMAVIVLNLTVPTLRHNKEEISFRTLIRSSEFPHCPAVLISF